MNPSNLTEACEWAKKTALQAWSAICHFHGAQYEIEEKPDGPSTPADKLADRLIVSTLESRYPSSEYGYLTEEFIRDPIRHERGAVWIIDPIDGTKDFIRGSGDFAIQIGLVVEDKGAWEPTLGVVYHPLGGKLYWAIRGAGAFSQTEINAHLPPTQRWWSRRPDDAPLPPESASFTPPQPLAVSTTNDIEQMVVVVSSSHRTRRLTRVLEIVPFQRNYSRGSVGIKLAEVAQQRADVYINTERGRCKEWDLCGPHLLLTEAGGTLTTLDGHPISYNHEEVRLMNGILASNGRAHQQLVDQIAPLTV